MGERLNAEYLVKLQTVKKELNAMKDDEEIEEWGDYFESIKDEQELGDQETVTEELDSSSLVVSGQSEPTETSIVDVSM